MRCDQSKYILQCFRDNGFIGVGGNVSLKKKHALPTVDEKFGEEDGPIKEKNDAMAVFARDILAK